MVSISVKLKLTGVFKLIYSEAKRAINLFFVVLLWFK